jgi:osmoprotectant transport system permease protein
VLNEVLEKLAGAITTDEMRRLNYEVDGKKRTPKEVAADFIKARGL